MGNLVENGARKKSSGREKSVRSTNAGGGEVPSLICGSIESLMGARNRKRPKFHKKVVQYDWVTLPCCLFGTRFKGREVPACLNTLCGLLAESRKNPSAISDLAQERRQEVANP